jgi:osmoprotectant transport system permease protein
VSGSGCAERLARRAGRLARRAGRPWLAGPILLTGLLSLPIGPASFAQDPAAAPPRRPVIVGSKPFGESYLLAELFAQHLEARGMAVERRPGLGATELAFGALRTGAIDVYPEYTGTGLVAILGEAPALDARAAFRRVAGEFERRYGTRWLPPLGFENSYAIAVRRETAEREGLRTLSDLARAAPRLVAGLTPDFTGRGDGLPALERVYGIHFHEVRTLLQAVKYQALASGAVDLIDGYATDGLIARYDLVVLEDDRAVFPPYEAAALLSERLWREAPEAVAALAELSGRMDAALMRRLNARVEVDGESIELVARAARRELGLVAASETGTAGAGANTPGDDVEVDSAAPGAPGLVAYLWGRRRVVGTLALRHLLLVALSLGAGIALAVPLGLLLERGRGGAELVIRGTGILQTIPGIALLAFMIPLLGIGTIPALVALFLYSLYPILRNTYTGVRDADPGAVDAARALGMTPLQALRYVRLPLAAPIIMAGIRTAGVISVGTATLAAFIGAGGLGEPIVAGLALSDPRLVLSGAIPAAALALLVDAALALCERWIRPGR